MSSMNGLERPTALTRRIDMSASGQRASGAPATNLAALREGSVRVKRVEPCVCGKPVIQETGRSIAEAVVDHNATRSHRAWRESNGVYPVSQS